MRNQSYTVGPWTVALDARAASWQVTVAHEGDDTDGLVAAGTNTEGGAMPAYLSAVQTARMLHARYDERIRFLQRGI